MMIKTRLFGAILIGIVFCNLSVHAQQNEPVLTALNQHIVEVKSFDSADTSEFSALKKQIAGFKVIGLGEATHGTKEFYEYKGKLVKYLVAHQGLKVLVFESDMVGMEPINDYVLGRAGLTLEKAMSNYGLFDIYRTQEVVDLIRWLRDYNLTQPVERKVNVAGMDANMPYHIASRLLLSSALNPYVDEGLRKDLAEIRSMPERRNFGKARKKYLLGVAEKLADLVKDNVQADSLETYSRYVYLLVQSLQLINLNDIELNTLRDKHMAENVLGLTAKTGDRETLAVWGHNGHICADKWRGYQATGAHLRNKLKNRYYALGLIVGSGDARLWDPRNGKSFQKSRLPAIEHTGQLEFVLQKLEYPNFFLDLKRVKSDAVLKSYLSKPLLTRVIGAQVVRTEQDILLPVRVDRAYDGVVFFRETSNAAEVNF